MSERDEFTDQGGAYVIDPATGKRVRDPAETPPITPQPPDGAGDPENQE